MLSGGADYGISQKAVIWQNQKKTEPAHIYTAVTGEMVLLRQLLRSKSLLLVRVPVDLDSHRCRRPALKYWMRLVSPGEND